MAKISIQEVYGDSMEDAKKNIRRSDDARAAYYKNISGRDWRDMHNYDFSINSSIGVDQTAQAIINLLNSRK